MLKKNTVGNSFSKFFFSIFCVPRPEIYAKIVLVYVPKLNKCSNPLLTNSGLKKIGCSFNKTLVNV